MENYTQPERFISARQENFKLGLIWRGQAKVLKENEVAAHLKKRNIHWRDFFSDRRKTYCRRFIREREPCLGMGSREIKAMDIKKF